MRATPSAARPLLEAGVAPLRDQAESVGAGDATPRSRGGIRRVARVGLHAKTFAVDGARIFVGSFNFDPRSAQLNTEMGFVIDSPALAVQIAERSSRPRYPTAPIGCD